jgi:4-hydroxybenzoate polyprenyltransferase
MLGIQFSIGALNDLVDAPRDAQQKPSKPIPSGHVTRRTAGSVAVVGAGLGIVLSAISSPATAIVGLACIGLGWSYDLRLSRTALSWLPLSLALPLLPIHAWLGAAGTIPNGLLTLVPVGVLGGGGLAIANGLADFERDASSGRGAIAVLLGRRRAWLAQAFVLGAAALLAIYLAPTVPDGAVGESVGALRMLRLGGVWTGVAAIIAGSAALASGRASIRERGWELDAIGVACLGIGWLAGTAGSV